MPVDIGVGETAPKGLSLAALAAIPTTILGDELGRRAILDAEIRPLGRVERFAGPALTVECAVGDISAILYALDVLQPGQVIMVDAQRHIGTAVWGEIMHTCAGARGAVGAVVDGSMRDVSSVARAPLPAYARGISARGPQASLTGAVNRPISCGGVVVRPGDLIVGDEDGLIVIAPEQIEGLLERCQARMAFEAEVLAGVGRGESARKLLGYPAPDESLSVS
jgi:regulator of RNase E activity RraA